MLGKSQNDTVIVDQKFLKIRWAYRIQQQW